MEGWFNTVAEKEAKRDRIKTGERIGNLIGIVLTIVVLWFFGDQLTSNTGFFTSAFGTGDQILFFAWIIVGVLPPLGRLIIGRKNAIRPVDIFMSAFFIVVSVYFLATFPFDFTHIADVLPSSLQGLLSWITNDFVKGLFVLGIVVSGIVIVYTALLYRAVRRKLKVQMVGS